MVTLTDIAKRAGVSPSTVSRVLSGKYPSKVSDKTRERVLAIAEELGYEPNIAAKALRSNQSLLFALIVPSVALSFMPEIVQALQEVAMAEDYSCLLYVTGFQPELEEEVFKKVLARRVDGVIWYPTGSSKETLRSLLQSIDIPVVQLLHEEVPHLPAVLVDQTLGGRVATSHLISLGHTRIRPLLMNDRHGRERYAGYVAAMRDAGLEPYEFWTVPDSFFEDAYRTVLGLSSQLGGVTAMVCYSDTTAWGAMRALRELGMQVPADVSLVGFDDLPISRHIETPLTTVAQPKSEIGEKAMDLLLKLIGGEQVDSAVLSPQLIERQSTRVVRTG